MACNHYKECMFFIKTIGILSARFASRPFCSAKQSVGFRYLHLYIVSMTNNNKSCIFRSKKMNRQNKSACTQTKCAPHSNHSFCRFLVFSRLRLCITPPDTYNTHKLLYYRGQPRRSSDSHDARTIILI